MKLLIVEDNEKMRCLIKCLLSDVTEAIYECTDGSEALNAYSEQRPDWVLMDIKMGKTDGIEATQQITAAFPDARVVIVTDYNIAQLSNFTFTGGSVLARDLLDPTSGMFGVGPAPGDVFGIGQPGATLQLSMASGDAFSLYSQQIVAGTLLSFDFILTTNF